MKASILIVDDDKLTRETLSRALSEHYTVSTARNGQEAIDLVAHGQEVDVILSDLVMPGLTGIDILERVNTFHDRPVVILITGQATIDSAVQAMKLGAYDYVTKPVHLDRLTLLIEKSLENKKLREENVLLKDKIRENYAQVNMIGDSAEMGKIMELIRHVSSTTATVLIEGESGSGKELIANIIHYNSPRADRPFIKINCSAFAEGVLESEIFGHERGAFTGAVSSKKGRFELADGGTLFLDEIGDIPLGIQVKLLRFLQEKTFERVGGNKTYHVDVRLLSATNKRLETLVKEGSFREDLYYRLRVVKIDVPPLRSRTGDIDELTGFFLNKYAKIHDRRINGISDEVMSILRAYNWPGNVRELMNCVESAVVLTRGDHITIDDVPDYLLSKRDGGQSDGHGILAELGRQAIIDTLRKTGGDKAAAAKILGIGVRTLYRKLGKIQV